MATTSHRPRQLLPTLTGAPLQPDARLLREASELLLGGASSLPSPRRAVAAQLPSTGRPAVAPLPSHDERRRPLSPPRRDRRELHLERFLSTEVGPASAPIGASIHGLDLAGDGALAAASSIGAALLHFTDAGDVDAPWMVRPWMALAPGSLVLIGPSKLAWN